MQTRKSINEIEDEQITAILHQYSSRKSGLTSEEVVDFRNKYGFNEIPEKKKSTFLKFLGNFWGPIPWMIEIAAVMSLIIQKEDDFYIILSLLLINAVVRFWEEHKADNAIELLKEKLALQARVLRDNKWEEIAARDLVPGDIIRIRLGDIIPADVKLIEGDYLLVDQSSLTGESLPVEKKKLDDGYAGTIVKQGEMDAIVTLIGIKTFFGKTTKLVEAAKPTSHFQKAVVKIGDYLITLAIVIVSIVFLISLFRHESILQTLQYVLILMVAAIPAALPAVLSVTMAIGAIALAKRGAIVSKLVSIEEMASMDVLCSDKTGTMTKNELTVGSIKSLEGFTDNDTLLYASLASREEDKDPIDTTIIEKAKTLPDFDKYLSEYEIKKFMPFDPIIKRTEATVVYNSQTSKEKDSYPFKISKGAPQVILTLIENKEEITPLINDYVNDFANLGYRALGVGKTDSNAVWHYIGIIALYDPPREDTAETIKMAKEMGVQVKMVTGDHEAIAKQIATQLNLGTNMVPVSSFIDEHEREASRIVEEADGFAEVFPEHKYHIVELLQKSGHIVGMTGDGVNDAPALRKADAGIAVLGSSDAAKSAADIVLTQPGISVTIDALKESRKIFQRMNNYSIYRIAETIRILFFIALSIMIFQFYPVTALMIVLLAILNDIPIMTIAYDKVIYSDEPERWNMRSLLVVATSLGFLGVFETFLLLFIGIEYFHLSPVILQSFIYLKLSVSGHFTLFVARTKGHFWTIRPATVLLSAIIITQLIATFITVYGILLPAMGWGLAAFIWIYAGIFFIVEDFVKISVYKLIDHSEIIFFRK
ncbi:MAG: plasma-membrane proton-efflux P-type ATPase [Candidatus Lokiarchaeota archaeon]